jgi:hypothetical protein
MELLCSPLCWRLCLFFMMLALDIFVLFLGGSMIRARKGHNRFLQPIEGEKAVAYGWGYIFWGVAFLVCLVYFLVDSLCSFVNH